MRQSRSKITYGSRKRMREKKKRDVVLVLLIGMSLIGSLLGSLLACGVLGASASGVSGLLGRQALSVAQPIATSISQAPTPVPTRTPAAARTLSEQVLVTFYAAYDNDPPGSRTIAYPAGAPRHLRATADLGTYDHPITLASDQRWLRVGMRVYVVSLHKYYIMEDECVSCESEYGADGTRHIDLYLSSSTSHRVIAAEEEATGNDQVAHTIVLNPPPNLPVDVTPLYSDSGGSVYASHHYGEALPLMAG